ncbi:hypothetical protein [Novosphingobium album (ex Liu et al. 2023)]|uniref:Uncharacterized protein n=1 Tax=Novosphingobium album (ex Liu et al. 2023) TaxID=3031130 RepID=A0ABT5WKC0_9SPHN|nr:hypothetical protein [Novosphingobium album (ex Liu et al. 2023)]MDE8650484.1 hypothetical protein [Novosphingobium album (ex Liu et al. 2023)]
MSEPTPILAPGQFVPIGALSFGALGGPATEVTPGTPLPVGSVLPPAASAPVAGTTSASQVAGPFIPELGRPVILALSGDWSGAVTLLRSTDEGETTLPATLAGDALVWRGNAQEAIWLETESGASLWLDVALTGGALSYRIGQ